MIQNWDNRHFQHFFIELELIQLLYIIQKNKMKQTLVRNNTTKQSNKSASLSKSPPQKSISSKKENPSKSLSKAAKYKIDAITKDNF